MKVAWVSNVLPPSHTAHAAIIQRLLRGRDPGSYVLLSGRDYVSGSGVPNFSERLPGTYYHLRSFRVTRGYRFGMSHVRHSLNLVLDFQRVLTIARTLRRERCDAIVAVTGGDEIFDFAASYLASRWVGIPFYAYLLDQFSHMVNFGMGRSVLRHLEPRMMKNAAAVIVPNEFLADDIRRQFAVDPVVLHNPVDLAPYEARPGAHDGIVYTGEIGKLHFSAFRNLLQAMEGNAKLHLYTIRRPPVLESDRVVFHGQRPLHEMPSVQTSADILFLPLALDSEHPNIIRTAAPGKLGEYLAARRPILVHAPADSFIAWYFRRYECGLVVDRNDPAAVREALRRLTSDAEMRRSLAERAGERARADFDLVKARAQLDAVLGW